MGENPFSLAAVRRTKPAASRFGEGNPYANAEIEGLSSEIVYRLRARRSTGSPRGGHLRLQRDRLSWGAPPPVPAMLLCGSFVLVGLSRYLAPRPDSVVEVPFLRLTSVRRGSGHGVLVVESEQGLQTYSNVTARAYAGLIERLARALRELDIPVDVADDGSLTVLGRAPSGSSGRVGREGVPVASSGAASGAANGATQRYRRQRLALGALAIVHLSLVGFNVANAGRTNDAPTTRSRGRAVVGSVWDGPGLTVISGGLVIADEPGITGVPAAGGLTVQ